MEDLSATVPLSTVSLPSMQAAKAVEEPPSKAAAAAAEAAKAEAARKQAVHDWRQSVARVGGSIVSILDELQSQGWWGGATRTQRSPVRKGNLAREIERVKTIIAAIDGTADPPPPRYPERSPNASPPRGRRIVGPSSARAAAAPQPPATRPGQSPTEPVVLPPIPVEPVPLVSGPRPPSQSSPVVPPIVPPAPDGPGALPTFLPPSARIERSTFMPYPDGERYDTVAEVSGGGPLKWTSTIFPQRVPGDRQDALLLHAWLDSALAQAGIAEAGSPERFDESLAIHSVVALELMREVSTASVERGLLLAVLWRAALAHIASFLATAKADRDRFDAASVQHARERAAAEEERGRMQRTILSLQSEIDGLRGEVQRLEREAATRDEELATERAQHKKLQGQVDTWMPQWREYFSSDLIASLPAFEVKESVGYKMRNPREYLRWRRTRSHASLGAASAAGKKGGKGSRHASSASLAGHSKAASEDRVSALAAAAAAAAMRSPGGSEAGEPTPPLEPVPEGEQAEGVPALGPAPAEEGAPTAGGLVVSVGIPPPPPEGEAPPPPPAEGGLAPPPAEGPSPAGGATPAGGSHAGSSEGEEEEDDPYGDEEDEWDEEEKAKIDWFSHLEVADILREDAERCLQAIAHVADHSKLVLKQELATAKADIAQMEQQREELEREMRATNDMVAELQKRIEAFESQTRRDAATQTERSRVPQAKAAAEGEAPVALGGGQFYGEWEDEAAGMATADAVRRVVSHASVPTAFRRLFATYISDEYVAQLMPVAAVKAAVYDIYSEKIVVDAVDDLEQKTRMTLPDFVYGYFLREYGNVRSRAELRLVDFFSSLRAYYEESVRIQTFCSLLGIPVGAKALSVYAVDFLLKVFGCVMLSGEVREGYDKSPWLPEAAAIGILRGALITRSRLDFCRGEGAEETARSALGRLADLVQVKEVPSRTEALTEALKEVERGRFVQLDRFLELALDVWQDEADSREPHYRQLFKAGTVESDGRMSVTEFRLVARECCPAATDRQLWRMCVSALRYSPASSGPDRDLGPAGRADTIGTLAFVATAFAFDFRFDDEAKLAILRRTWEYAEEAIAQAVRALKDSVARPRAYVNAIQAMTRVKRILEVSEKMAARLTAAELDDYLDTFRALVGEVPPDARERILAEVQVAGIKTWGAATEAAAAAKLQAPDRPAPAPAPPPPPASAASAEGGPGTPRSGRTGTQESSRAGTQEGSRVGTRESGRSRRESTQSVGGGGGGPGT